MTLGRRARRRALLAMSLFADGSLMLVDDSLSVNGGGTVDLRVRLGAKPRSDVTVALTEASPLISLAVNELTFTPQNWDQYQSVTVTGPTGNRQEFTADATQYFPVDLNDDRGWVWPPGSYPEINVGLRASTAFRALNGMAITDLGRVSVRVASSQSPTGSRADLSTAFENSGSVTFKAGVNEVTALLEGADTEEPYIWIPTNSAEVIAFYNALPTTEDSQAGSFILRDYEAGDITISLAASGPPEYDAKTASVTVAVS